MRFADPKSDIAFKKIFGNENRKEILISFLNAVLELPRGRRILHVDILNPYQAPRIEGMKETTLDVRATDQRDIHYIVEMQVQKRTGFEKRVQYYSARAYSSQIHAADEYPELNQVLFIGICDFSIFEGTDYLTRHLILNQATLKQELKDLEFNFIELTKFDRESGELKGIIEEWIYFIKNAPDLKMVPAVVSDRGLRAAYEVAGMHTWTEKELDLYDYWAMRLQDERGALEYAAEEGLRKGREEGRKQGEEEGLKKGRKEGEQPGRGEEKRQIARHLKRRGYPVADIVEATGLSEKEIQGL